MPLVLKFGMDDVALALSFFFFGMTLDDMVLNPMLNALVRMKINGQKRGTQFFAKKAMHISTFGVSSGRGQASSFVG
jgi:hypothetical protein